MPNDEIRSLRQALDVSPDNVPLRKLLAETLVRYGFLDDALAEYGEALKRATGDRELSLGMARALFQKGELEKCELVLEPLLAHRSTKVAACVLYARLLVRREQLTKAADYYSRALAEDPSCRDEQLDERLEFHLGEFTVHDEEDDDEDDEPMRMPAGDLPPRGEERASFAEVEKPRLNFDDVGGMDGVKEEVRIKIIHPMTHPELFEAYGKKVGGGILLYGPPGCGKTYLSRATAGEVKANFISVGLHDVLDMYIGQSEHKLHELFETARRQTPCVLFFDEVDALGAKRSDLRQSAGRQLINQFLAEMDGVQYSNDGVLILAATNAPWHLDTAFRRPGRFDQILFVPPPDTPARAAILRVLAKGKPTEDIDHEAIARKTEGFSGADLKAVLDQAVEDKLREAMKKGALVPIRTKDLLKAAKKVKPSAKEWFSTARNYALYSNEGGLYDDILRYLNIKI